MSDQDTIAKLTEQLASLTGSAAGGGWNQPAANANPASAITAVSIPIKVDTPMGSVRAYLELPGEVGQNPQTLMNAIQGLVSAGYPVDAWQPKSSGDWRNSGGNSGGGWNNDGGYRRGGGGYGGGFRRGNY